MRIVAKAPSAGSTTRQAKPLGRTGIAFACLLALLACSGIGAPAAGAAAPPKGINGFLGSTGSLGGQLDTPRGVGVNQSNGTIYLADTANDRISVFSSSGTFLRAFGQDVVKSGPGQGGASEVQSIAVKATSGTFTLTFSSQTTAPLDFDASASAVQAALNSLSTIKGAEGSVTVSGGPGDATGSSPYSVTFGGALKGLDVAQIAINASGLGVALGTELSCTAGPGGSATLTQQWLRNGEPIPGATSPTYTTVVADEGAVIQCEAFAANAGPGTIALSATTHVASPFPASAPPSSGTAAMSGGTGTFAGVPGLLYLAGDTLTCAPDGWGAGTSFAFQWYLNGSSIAGATSSTYTVQPADVPGSLQCRVTGTNAGGSRAVLASSPALGTYQSSPQPSPGPPATSAALAPLSGAATTAPGSGGTEYETCIPTNGDVCKAGITSASTGGAMSNPQGVALDALGNVYVSEQDKLRVQKFNAAGEFLLAFGKDVIVNGSPSDPGSSTTTQVCEVVPHCKAAASGSLGGEFASTFNGQLAIAPAGAPNAGNVLVADPGGLRVQEFTSAGAFVRAFGWDVAGVNEVQTVLRGITGNVATGGTYRLCKDVAMTECTGDLAFNLAATGATSVQTALQAPAMFGAGNVTVSGTGSNARTVTFTGSLTGTDVEALVCDGAKLTYAGAPPSPLCTVTTTTQGAGGSLTTFEECTTAAHCKAGVSGSGSGQFANSVNRVAEDADGNLYTVESGTPNFRVQRFTLPGNVVTPQGNFAEGSTKGTSSSGSTQNNPTDVAVNPQTKNVLVTKVFPAASTPSCPGTGSPSVQERRILELSQAGALEATHLSCAAINSVNGIATRGSTGEVFVSSTTGASRLYILNTPLLDPTVGFNAITGVTHNGATVSGFVNPNGPAALPYGSTTSYQFRYKRSADPTFIDLPAAPVNVGKGTTSQLVSIKLPALEPTTSYDVQLRATKQFAATTATDVFSFSTAAAKAEVGIPSATTLIGADEEADAALYGRVNPNGKATTYRFEYGTTASYGNAVPVPDASAGSGSADVKVAEFLEGLVPGTTYHFRLVAKNVNGLVASPDRTFTTPPIGAPGDCPNEAIRREQDSTYLPDCRAFELVTPADKGPAGSVAVFPLFSPPLWNQAAAGGDSVLYPIQNGVPDSTAGGWTRWRADRTGDGWLSTEVSGPSLISPPQGAGGALVLPSRVWFMSPDLQCSVLESFNPLTDDIPAPSLASKTINLFVWRAGSGYELITNEAPLNPGASPVAAYKQVEASDDCSRVYFHSPFYDFPGAPSDLLEWEEGTLRDAGVLPDGTVGDPLGDDPADPPAVAGGEASGQGGTSRWNAVSPSGSRFFFTAVANEGPSAGTPAVFMRTDGESVVEISASQTAVPTNGARFETASPDGSRVIFRANYGIATTGSSGPTDAQCGPISGETDITSNPSVEAKACDLYAYDVDTGELTDLSADANPADPIGAAVQGAVAVDEDGSHVYFAALGQLIPGKGRTYVQNVAGTGSANVYLNRDGELAYVATLERGPNSDNASGDLFASLNFGVFGALMRRASKWRAETTADGSRLLFTSSSNLIGYDGGGAKMAYLYRADTGELTCVSCPPIGAPTLMSPTGKFPTESAQVVGLLTLPVSEDLTRRPRSMSEDGRRVIFSSLDALTPGAVPGRRNVYQWQDGQVRFLAIAEPSGGAGLGEVLDLSASGDSVFIATKEQLVPQDTDLIADVYSVRVDGGFAAAPPPPPECQVDESVPLVPNQIYCQGDPTPQPQGLSPSSASFSGPSNPPEESKPPARRTCPKGKVRRRGKCVKRPKKAAKRKRSRAAKTDRGGVK